VPADLAAERVAPHVAKQGLRYLTDNGYVLMSDWGDNARPIDPSDVDWQAVADGKVLVRLRQNPGAHNAMGRMKFMFPNPQGIYLHDTPNKELLQEEARLFSGGCVRLEDAPRLARWMYGRPLTASSRKPELRVDLPRPTGDDAGVVTAVHVRDARFQIHVKFSPCVPPGKGFGKYAVASTPPTMTMRALAAS